MTNDTSDIFPEPSPCRANTTLGTGPIAVIHKDIDDAAMADILLGQVVDRRRMAWQKASGYNLRPKVEASTERYKRVIGNALRARTDRADPTEVALAAAALKRMPAFGHLNFVRIA